jgi:hypothetical protein
MAYYLQSTTEENLYLCIINGVWGSKTNKLSQWKRGDHMLVYVNRALAALFEITSESFYDESPVWPEDVYPYRVKLDLQKIIAPDQRYSISNADTRQSLFKHHTTAYGVTLVLGARPLESEPANLLLHHLEESPDWEGFDASSRLETLTKEQELEQIAIAEEAVQARPRVAEDIEAPSPHTQMQFYLAKLGRSLGFQVWIPKADQGLVYDGQPLEELSEAELPELPFNDYVIRIIRNIDVIWLQDDHPVRLFEVEHTTSIYSGLLRMSDLVSLIPSLTIQIYICASESRKEKVGFEVKRPTFNQKSLQLAKRCRLISFEKLEEFMRAEQQYIRHFSVSILDELSESLASI